MTLKDLIEMIALLGSLLMSYSAYRKAHFENRKIEAESDNLHEDAADKAARRYIDSMDRVEKLEQQLEQQRAAQQKQQARQDAQESENRCLKADNEALRLQVSQLRERQDALEQENSRLRAENEGLQDRIDVLEADNAELRELVSKLTAQVAEMGGEPVKPKRAGGRHT